MFTVYMHISPSNKRYIGITSTSTKHRWGNNGICYRPQPYFWKAIQKYGWDNFEHIIIAENLTKEEACKMEIELIKQYNSNNSKYGYNVSTGGEHIGEGVKRTDTWKRHMSQVMRGNLNRVHKNSPEQRKAISERMKGNDFGSRRNITNDYKEKALISQPNRVVIEQYTLSGELIATFRSVNEAHKLTGIWNIAEASRPDGRSKTSGGYIWKRKAI